MLRPVGWLLVITLTALAAPALADNKTDAEKAFGEGKTKYAAGDYANAAKDFKKAYELDPDPAYLFNLAQAYRLAEDCVNAAPAYEKFLKEVSNPPNKDAVEGWLQDAKKCAATKQPKEPPKDPLPPPKDPIPPKDPLPPKDTGTGGGPPIAAIASVTVGVAAIILGVIETKKVSTEEKNYKHQSSLDVCVHSMEPETIDKCDGAILNPILDSIDKRGKQAQAKCCRPRY